MALQVEFDVGLELFGVLQLFGLQRRETVQKIKKEFAHRLLFLRGPVCKKIRRLFKSLTNLYQTRIQNRLPPRMYCRGYT